MKSANDFLNSLGANSSISRRGELLDKTLECVKYTGIRWFRSGYEGNIPLEDQIFLHNEAGVKYSYGLASGGNDIPRLIKGAELLADAGALLAVEGNNEPNNWGITHNGEKGGRDLTWLPVAKIQADLYKAVKNNPKLKDYPVFSIGGESGAQVDNAGLQFLTIPEDADTLMPAGTVFADYANVHNYFCHPSLRKLIDNITWYAADPTLETVPNNGGKYDNLYGNYGVMWGKGKFKGYSEEELKTLPRVTTETGITVGTYDGAVDEEMHGRLIVSMYLSQFAQGYDYTALYILRDRSDESGNQTFGMYAPDYTPRKAAHYMHNLTTILADDKSPTEFREFNYSIANQPETVHDMLLQKSDGSLCLVIWNERFTGGTDDITVNFGSTCSVEIYDIKQGTEPIQKYSNIKSVDMTLHCNPYIIKIN
jgi:hypothetical protein